MKLSERFKDLEFDLSLLLSDLLLLFVSCSLSCCNGKYLSVSSVCSRDEDIKENKKVSVNKMKTILVWGLVLIKMLSKTTLAYIRPALLGSSGNIFFVAETNLIHIKWLS